MSEEVRTKQIRDGIRLPILLLWLAIQHSWLVAKRVFTLLLWSAFASGVLLVGTEKDKPFLVFSSLVLFCIHGFAMGEVARQAWARLLKEANIHPDRFKSAAWKVGAIGGTMSALLNMWIVIVASGLVRAT